MVYEVKVLGFSINLESDAKMIVFKAQKQFLRGIILQKLVEAL